MPQVRIAAALPFPVRVNPMPYQVESGDIGWTMTFERVQRETLDERLGISGANDVDFAEDRDGQLAYSRVTAEADLAGSDESILHEFLAALNLFIGYVRDTSGQ